MIKQTKLFLFSYTSKMEVVIVMCKPYSKANISFVIVIQFFLFTSQNDMAYTVGIYGVSTFTGHIDCVDGKMGKIVFKHLNLA